MDIHPIVVGYPCKNTIKKKRILWTTVFVFYFFSNAFITDEFVRAIFIKDYLISIGIPNRNLIIESKNTRENAVFSTKILNERYTNGKYTLVTSAMHTPRAKRCFQQTKLTVTPFSVDHQAGPRKYVFDHLFIPDLDSLRRWKV